MTELSAHLVQWMPLTAAIAFILGETYADLRRRRKHLREVTDELSERLKEAQTSTDSIHRALKQQRGVINDIHRRLLAVSKGLEKRPS
jgi:hypothetical protein